MSHFRAPKHFSPWANIAGNFLLKHQTSAYTCQYPLAQLSLYRESLPRFSVSGSPLLSSKSEAHSKKSIVFCWFGVS